MPTRPRPPRPCRVPVASLLLTAALLVAPAGARAAAADAPVEPFSWFGMSFGSGMLPWFQHPRAGFSMGAGAQQGPGFLAFDLAAGAGPVAAMPEAVAFGTVLAGVVAGVAAEGEARPFAAVRAVGGFVISNAFEPVMTPAPHIRLGGSFGLMVRPGGRPGVADPHAVLRPGHPGGRLSLEPSLALLPVAGLFGFTLELKFAALVW